MALIQSAILTREGKKWKQRWAVLKKISPKAGHESYCYLLLYKDASHAQAGKEKLSLPLIDFCGMNSDQHYDKIENVLIIITLTQTMFLSFNQKMVFKQWINLLLAHFGESVTFDISIPDKQCLKSGHATIRLYSTFFSIITNKHYKCISRWFSNDILRYSALDNSHFFFEIATKSKSQIVNLLVPNNAYEIAKAFDINTNQNGGDDTEMVRSDDFRGSGFLDDLQQAKRNVGDQNFFQRVILRASNHMKRKKKNKKQNPTHFSSVNDETKFRSLDRHKKLNVVFDPESMNEVIKLSRCQTHPLSPAPPPLPQKNSRINSVNNSLNEDHTKGILNIDCEENPCLKNTVSNTGDIVIKKKCSSQSEIEKIDLNEDLNKEIDSTDCQANSIDKSNTFNSLPRKSVDRIAGYKPTSRASGKVRKTSVKQNESGQMPTPPPRSPISLGQSVFNFSNENLDKVEDNLGNLETVTGVLDSQSFDKSNDCVVLNQNNDTIPSFKAKKTNYLTENEPVYGNVEALNHIDDNVYHSDDVFHVNIDKNIPRRKTITAKHLSDPISVETWKMATGDGQYPIVDYVNVKGRKGNSLNDSLDFDINNKNAKMNRKHHSDEDSDSYVNVSSDQVHSSKFVKALHSKNYKNEFEKYDDEDPSIYHAVRALKDERLSHSSDAVTHGDGSYENINNVTRTKQTSDYLNLMSPKAKIQNINRLNYIMVSGKDPYRGNYKSSPVSPVHSTSKPQTEMYERSEYTRIDENMTGLLNKSMLEHQQQRDKSRTPSKLSK